MKHTLRLALMMAVGVAALSIPLNNFVAHAQVPESVQIDLLRGKIKSAIKSKDSDVIHSSIEGLKELNTKIEPTWYIENAKGGLRTGAFDRAEVSLNEYVENYGAESWQYRRKVLPLYQELALKRDEAAVEAAKPAPVKKETPKPTVISAPKVTAIVVPKVEPKAELKAATLSETEKAKQDKLKKDAEKLKKENAALAKKLRDKAAADDLLQAQKDEELRLELDRKNQEIYLAKIAREAAEADAQAARDLATENQRLMEIQRENDRLALERDNARALEDARLDAIRAEEEREKSRRSAAFAKEVWSRKAVSGGQSASITSLSNGAVIVGGNKGGLGYMAGLSSSGSMNWERMPDAFRSITTLVPSRSDAFYAGGTHPRKFIAGKYNASGEKIWKLKLDADGTSHEVVDFYEVSGGGVIIGAEQTMPSGNIQVVFLGMDDKGETAWRTDAPQNFASGLTGFARIDGRIVARSWSGNFMSISPSTGDVTNYESAGEPDGPLVVSAEGEFELYFANGETLEIGGNRVTGRHKPTDDLVTGNLDGAPVDASIINNTDIVFVDENFGVTRLTNLSGDF